MAKLKNIIKQLSLDDYTAIYDSLIESNAEKSAFLLKTMREKSLSDQKIMAELEVNNNAYYTLRSRLNQKIEEYLLQQMESPRTDLLKKVANINEIIFTKKRAISVATLKKLEKELLDYDLSNELTIVYKTLKKLHINTADHFHYSQLYNKHVAYMLAVDKAEDLLAEYFKKFGEFSLTGDETDKLGLTLMASEMDNVCGLYNSHRLYVYQNCLSIFHRLFIERGEKGDDGKEPIEDILDNIQKIFDTYFLDSIYFHLKLVFEFLRLEYYAHYNVFRKAEKFFDEVNEQTSALLSNYGLYTYPPYFLQTRLERAIRHKTEGELYEENLSLFQDYECDKEDVSKYINYVVYRSISCYYAGKYEEAARFINNMLNDVSLKKYPYATLEVKSVLALHYCLLKDYDLFHQLVNSIQRQIRLMGKDQCEDVVFFIKILKISISDAKRDKATKIKVMISKFESTVPKKLFSPTRLIVMDDKFVEALSVERLAEI
ncbi:hypothetical protein R9C00_28180 [Flammeovirgaceae bacterium SG7u.111]|nr:hypothetical protein [Flammeovirgaceae bacterium SG7u.132]WPO35579.1 hypothetical protein R9C00_28180 [Flammeovirgaceae bacterium SG7u.111]